MTIAFPPVITIDGPTASGKGTVAHGVAQALGWHVLDSGALYRVAALCVAEQGVNANDEQAVADAVATMDVAFRQGGVWLSGQDVSRLFPGVSEPGALKSHSSFH